jgi:hypothetical protein
VDARQAQVPAKAEIANHLDGELTVRPLPSTRPERPAEIRGRVKPSSLLAEEEAAFLRLVAGGRFAFTATAYLDIYFEVVV